MSIVGELVTDKEPDRGSELGYVFPEDIELFANSHPNYRPSKGRLYRRFWDALATYQGGPVQQATGRWEANIDDGGLARELFHLTPTLELNHFFGLCKQYPDAAGGFYFGTAVWTGGVSLNLDTLSILFNPDNPAYSPRTILDIGSRGKQLAIDYLRFSQGEVIEFDRNNYTQPRQFGKFGRLLLARHSQPEELRLIDYPT